MKKKKEKKKRKNWSRKFLSDMLEKSGLNLTPKRVSRIIFNTAIIINLLITAYIIYRLAADETTTLTYLLVVTSILWVLFFAALLLLLWLLFYFFLDYMMYRRRVGLEEVFPDFLQLTSANIRAGMPIDQALWHAIRPNFGVLAKEMEDVAKETMSGTDLEEALKQFAQKYDSNLLKRSISLLIEGLNAGGEIGELLDRISTNIQESKMMAKEMSASVTTYAIFIGFASVLAAPFLLALSSQLLIIIKNIVASIDVTSSQGMMIGLSKVSVEQSDFRIFAYLTLSITSILSAAIVATIKKGNIKAGLKYIPMFLFASLLLFLFLDYVLGIFMSGMF